MRFGVLSFSLLSLLPIISLRVHAVPLEELYLDGCSAETGRLVFCHFMVNLSDGAERSRVLNILPFW